MPTTDKCYLPRRSTNLKLYSPMVTPISVSHIAINSISFQRQKVKG